MMRNSATAQVASGPSLGHLAVGFVAGFLAVLIFHQGMLGILHSAGITPAAPYQTGATAPFGVPQVFSLAFWGGLWGIVFAYLEPRLPSDRTAYFLWAILFGAIAPTLVAWFLVAPMKGGPVAGGWRASALATGLLVNGAWGFGTALFLQAAARIAGARHPA